MAHVGNCNNLKYKEGATIEEFVDILRASWNFAVGALGSIKTGIYIYLVPIITMLAAWLILGEGISWMAGAGVGLILLGLLVSEGRLGLKAGAPRAASG